MVLIIGASGLVGSHLILHLLENNEPVRAIYRNQTSIKKTQSLFQLYQKLPLFEKINWVQADITDVPSLEPAFENVTHVYHCAAYISFDPADEKLLRKTNIEGTANIVNYCLDYGVKKLCYVSSIAALGDPKEGEPIISEATEWNPEQSHSDYAISKYGAEMEVWRAYQEGLPVAIVNPGVILGAGFWETGSGEIFTRVKNKLPFYTKGSTGFITVADVVKMLHQLMKNDISGERFVAVAETFSFEEMLQIVARSLQVQPPKIEAKPWMTAIAWRLDWLRSVFGSKRTMSKLMAQALHQKQAYANEKAKSQLQFEFQDVEKAVLQIGKLFPD